MKPLFSILIALVLAVSSWANSPHVRVHVSGDGSTGSGTLIDRALVLTCGHLFTDSASGIVVRFRDGRKLPAQLVKIDRANDLAAVAIEPVEIQPFTVSGDEPVGTLTACGYGPYGQFAGIRGAITGHAQSMGATHPSTTIAGSVRSGDSGGGVFNERNELVGVIWGTARGETYAMCGQPVREFVQQTQYYGGNCSGGVCSPPSGYYTQPSRPVRPVQPSPQPTPQPVAQQPAGKPCDCAGKWQASVAWQATTTNAISEQNKILQQQVAVIQQFQQKLNEQAEATTNIANNIQTTVGNRVENYLQQHPADVPDSVRQQIKNEIMLAVTQALQQHDAANKPPTVEQVVAEVLKQLDHDTPIRVYLPDGRLAGETKTNLFRKDGSIDFTFNPRALLDASK